MTGIETAIAIAGVAAQAGGTLMAGLQQSAAMRATAKSYDNAARSELIAGNQEAGQLRRRAQVETGRQIATAAGSGVQLEGSPLDVIFQNATEMELDAMQAFKNRERTALAYKDEADALRGNAKATRTGAFIGAGTQLLFGAANQFGSFGLGGSSGPAGMYAGGTGTNPLTGLRYGGV